MAKLSKQAKIEIYQLWHSYGVGVIELSQRYRVAHSNISYLLGHGLAVLDQPYTTYISNFRKQVLRRIIVEHETVDRVLIDLGLKNYSMLHNWLREYRKNEYNIVNKQRVRLPMTKREQMIKHENHRFKQENEFVKRLSVLVD